MVSIFGIKLGSDRKKDKAQQTKQGNDKNAQLRKGSSNDKKSTRESQYFGNNFSRPNASASPRPGTSYSTRRTTLFHQPFTFPPASSSMVDLAPPGRRPSVGSLRQHASDADLKGSRDWNESPVPPPVLAPPTRRPGTADRPLSSRKSAWINPLDVHYAREPAAANLPETPPTNTSATMSPFSDFEFGLAPKSAAPSKTEPAAATEGYPSPPASISSIDPLASVAPVNPDNRPSSSRRNAPPSGLRRVNTLDEIEGPPTPERTVSQTSEDQLAGAPEQANTKPVVRNVRAKRETLAFHQPRQPSMIMDFDGAPEKRWERDTNDEANKPPPAVGFEGNFAAFDFGETVRRASVSIDITPDSDKRSTAHTMHTISNFSGHPSLDTMGSALAAQWPSPPTEANDVTLGGSRERTLSDARSFASLNIKRDEAVRSAAPPVNLDSPIIPPDHFRSRDLIPPRPHTSGGPRTSPGPPPAAAGAHRGGLSGLDPPPRGFLSRPRVGSASGPSTRAPPKPLQLRPLADRSEPSPRDSPFGPPPDEGSYLRADGDSRHPTEPSPYGPTLESEGNYMRSEGSARRPPEVPGSPFTRATPIEGDFPVTKGLPRGRRPTFPSQPTPTSEDTTAPSPTPENTTALGLPSWIDRATARQSAMPAPLSPLRGLGPTSSPRAPASPHRPLRSDEFTLSGTPTSNPGSGAPRLPSPTFHSLEKSISSSSENLARTFVDFSFDNKPLISPVLGDFVGTVSGGGEANSGKMSPRRVEGRTAPPRPSPVTLPPSSGERVKTPGSTRTEFTSTFI